MTSNKIMKIAEYKPISVIYKCSCSCLDNNHDLWIDVEQDREFQSIELSFTINVGYYSEQPDYSKLFIKRIPTNIKNLWYRLKKSIELLFTGYLESENTFMITDEEQMNDLINALNEGKQLLKKWRVENNVTKA